MTGLWSRVTYFTMVQETLVHTVVVFTLICLLQLTILVQCWDTDAQYKIWVNLIMSECNEVDRYGKKEAGTGEHLNTFNQINKHNRKAAAPHGRLPHTKHKVKSRPGLLSSSNVVTPPFIPSEAPPWDSRPVSGAGVVHYHSLHRPRSVPTALGPAPLVTLSIPALLCSEYIHYHILQ